MVRVWVGCRWRRVVRRVTGEPDGETAIVPVLWAPFLRSLPPEFAEINRFTPMGMPDSRYNARYQEYGVLGLMRTRQDDVYDTVVEPSVLSSFDGLRTTFGKEDG